MNKPRIGPLLRQALTRSALHAAWEKVAENQGAAGSDGERIGDIARNLHDVLADLARSVVAGHYQPEPLRRVWIARPGKSPRGLAIPAVRDRILQTSVTLALTPRVENELEDCSFAYRQGRGVRQAAERINYYQRRGYRWVVDADIESFFDNIPHAGLLTRLEALVPEAALIELVAQWLTAEIIDQGHCHRPRQGIPQGSPISPLLANLYLDTLDEALLDANHVLVRYADDFVVLAKTRERAEQALELTRDVLERIALRLNPIKTRIGAAVALDLAQELVGGDAFAIGHLPDDLCRRIAAGDAGVEPGRAADHAGFTADHGGAHLALTGDQTGRQVAGTDILGQGGGDIAGDFFGERVVEFNAHGVAIQRECW